MARTFEPLARRLCQAVHDLTGPKSNAWVSESNAATKINVSNQELIDGAITHSVQMGWLQADGKPVHRLRLTPAGLATVKKKRAHGEVVGP
jgi:hypothetical protein